MPLMTVNDDDGSVLHYEDTGPPLDNPKDYLTVIFLHGLGINGMIFNRVLPLAATHHSRFVVVSSREYLSSSKFSEEDLEALRSGIKEEQAAVIAKLGQELAIFLSRFIKTHEIPKVSKRGDERLGGLAVMAWSLGCTTLLSFLSQVLEFSKELRDHLGEYLRTVVAYDNALSAYGIPPPAEFSLSPWRAEVSPEERFKIFTYYASIYQTPVPDIQDVSIPYLLGRTDAKQATLEQLSPEDYDMVVDKNAFAKWALFTRAPLVVQENAIRAYFDPKGAQIWPNVNVKVLWCDSGSWGMILGAKWLADRISEWRNGMRKVELVRLEDANHFMHWEEPERFTRVLMNHLA